MILSKLSQLREKAKMHKKQFLFGVCIFALGSLIGYLSGGGMVTPLSEDEIMQEVSDDNYQYLPKDGSLDEALASGHYSHCLVYPGIGLKFKGKDNNGDLIVGQSILTYPANKAQIFPGTKVSTPMEVLRGEVGSPVKVEFKQGLTTKSEILARVMVKKCWKKTSADSTVDGWEY
jgi:hypothetical protein